MTPGMISLILLLEGQLSTLEADKLEEGLKGKEVPFHWFEIKKQIESIIGRPLAIHLPHEPRL